YDLRPKDHSATPRWSDLVPTGAGKSAGILHMPSVPVSAVPDWTGRFLSGSKLRTARLADPGCLDLALSGVPQCSYFPDISPGPPLVCPELPEWLQCGCCRSKHRVVNLCCSYLARAVARRCAFLLDKRSLLPSAFPRPPACGLSSNGLQKGHAARS